MQKKPTPPGGQGGPKINRTIGPNPSFQKAPPRPMVTADERRQQKEVRRAAPTPPAPTPAAAPGAAPTAADALQLEANRFNGLQERLMLTQINDELEDIDSAIAALPANVENMRARGYVFKSYLEKKVETLSTQWRDLKPRVQNTVQTQQRALQGEAGLVGARVARRQLAGPALDALESKLGAAIHSLEGMYDALDDNINQTQQQLDDISWTLQQAEQACFGFLPTEAPVEAVPANWKKPGDKDGVDGVLYLTDQRLIFEQKEQVATKKMLFITTEKQTVQSLAWAVPAAQIAKALGSKKGFMSKDDYLTITLAEGAGLTGGDGQPLYDDMGRPQASADIHLKGETGAAWQGYLGRVKSGEIAKERTVPVDTAAQESVTNAPTKCTTCGATLTQTILRGQTEVKCEYCGSVMRL
jgi:hypothetical protein